MLCSLEVDYPWLKIIQNKILIPISIILEEVFTEELLWFVKANYLIILNNKLLKIFDEWINNTIKIYNNY